MNLPNQLTIARLLVTFIFVAVMSIERSWSFTAALWLFVTAAITDWLDGWIARRYGLITNFGKLMDPLVDKVMITAAFVMLSAHGLFPAWALVIILAREFLVTGLRLLATSQGAVLAADSLGKWKTTLQIVTSIYFLLYLASQERAMSLFRPLFQTRFLLPGQLGHALIVFTLLMTVASGLHYLRKNWALVKLK